MRLIAVAAVAHMLRSRRFYERRVPWPLLWRQGQIGQQNQACTKARLAAWDKRQVQRLER